MSHPEHQDLPIHLVDEPDAATRLDIDPVELDSLARSIREFGQLQPGGVVVNGDRYTVAYGHRRLLACRKLEVPTYRAYVYQSTTEAMLGAQLAENVERADINPVEEAYWFAQLMDALHCDTTDLAERLKKNRNYVEGRLNLLRGDALVLDALKTGKIGLGVAETLNSVPADAPRRMFLDLACRTNPKRATVQQWIAEWRAAGAPTVQPSAPIDPNAPPDPDAFAPATPTCFFCGDGDNSWMLQFLWIHSYCNKALNNILDRKAENVPVSHG